jgi:hypothetical protein
MERLQTVHCGQCHQPIISGEGFVCFKVPGDVSYQFFHCRFRIGDCWEEHFNEHSKDLYSAAACHIPLAATIRPDSTLATSQKEGIQL